MATGSIFDNTKHNIDDNKKFKEIEMNDIIELKVVTVTPFLQMDTDGEQRKRYVNEDEFSYKEPFWSANGIRGMLRRVATRDLILAINKKEPDYKLNAENLFLYTSGAGADKKSIDNVDSSNEAFVRASAPILSLFGAGLSNIAGKTAVDDFRISSAQKKYISYIKNDKEYAISKYLETHTYVRDDSSIKQEILSEMIDQDDIKRWQEEHSKNVANAKKAKKEDVTGNTKESTSNMQQLLNVEAIMSGTTLISSINPINYSKFTNIELGCLVKTLVSASTLQIGSAKRYGYGRFNWDVSLNKEKLFFLKREKDYTPHFELTITQKGKDIIAIYDNWLSKNATSQNIDIKDILKKAEKENK
jgi:CRISPR type IV-associated protein Csf2